MSSSGPTSSSAITCPACAHEFEASAAMEQSLREKFRAEFNQKWTDQKKKQDEESARKEAQLQKQLQQLEQARAAQSAEVKKKVEEECSRESVRLKKEIEEQSAHSFGAKLRHLEEQAQRSKDQLAESQRRELDYERQKEAFEKREAAMELDKQKAINAERIRIQEEVRRAEDERFKVREEQSILRIKEYELKLEEQKKLIEEMKRRSEQGSMQTQGEAQEMALEELLRAAFPYDSIKEVGKGMRGADCILTVRNAFGQECGCIIFESKRTQAFGGDWIEKLKADMMSCKAEIAVIVSQVYPKDMDRFGERQGVYVCSFGEVKSLVAVLRGAIMKLAEARASQENKGDKMVALYDYLTSSEFMAPWNTMRESFAAFRGQLQKERDDFEKNWKKKEKMLDMIIRNSLQISGSIEGISGVDSMNWSAGAIVTETGYLVE